MIKSFFMAALSANLQGRPLVSFNVVTAIPTRNVTAAALQHIQAVGAQMVKSQEIEFDDLVIQNLFHLGDMTEEQFVEGVRTEENMEEAIAEAVALGAEADATATADEALAADVDQAPAGDVLEPKHELVVDNTVAAPSDAPVDTNNVQAEEQAEASKGE